MPKIMIDLNKQENKIVELYKIENELITKAQAVKRLILEGNKNGNSKRNKR